MDRFYNEKLQMLEAEIVELEIKFDCFTLRTEATISIIIKYLSEIKEFVLKHGFKSKKEEIFFYKHFKPKIVAKLVYYNTIYKIETKKPTATKAINKYLKAELKKIKRFFNNNLDFYKYYRTGNTSLDDRLFMRGGHDIKLCLDTYYFQSDHNFSTSHDYKVAQIIANDLIQVYIEDQLGHTNEKSMQPRMLKWTNSKIALIELIYALYYKEVFNNGNADIREIAKYFESVFNIELGNFYQTFLELRNRKMNRTKFLDAVRDGLMKKMDDLDGR